MNTKRTFLTLLLAVILIGCSKHPEPRHIVILIDVSGSIDRESLGQAFNAIDQLVGHLHRGDRIAIIPILGDAQAEAPGRIIRFQVPTTRQPYDGDLHSFRMRLKASLDEMKAIVVVHPGSKTDILGAIALAEQDFHAASDKSRRLLVILSDFIQEDREVDFKKDKRLSSQTIAADYAMHTMKAHPLDFNGVFIYLGLLRSREYGDLSQSRRESIHEFWVRYFNFSSARPTFVTDGSGLLERVFGTSVPEALIGKLRSQSG